MDIETRRSARSILRQKTTRRGRSLDPPSSVGDIDSPKGSQTPIIDIESPVSDGEYSPRKVQRSISGIIGIPSPTRSHKSCNSTHGEPTGDVWEGEGKDDQYDDWWKTNYKAIKKSIARSVRSSVADTEGGKTTSSERMMGRFAKILTDICVSQITERLEKQEASHSEKLLILHAKIDALTDKVEALVDHLTANKHSPH